MCPNLLYFAACNCLHTGLIDRFHAAGSKYVFHVASPAVLTAEDHQRDIVDPAVEVSVPGSCAYFMCA